MRTAGNGPDRPLDSNATPEGREKNRRTDIKALSEPRGLTGSEVLSLPLAVGSLCENSFACHSEEPQATRNLALP